MNARFLPAIVLAAMAFLASTPRLALSESAHAPDLSVYDRILKDVKPGQTWVRFGDVGITVERLRQFRAQLARGAEADFVTPGGTAFLWPAGNVYYRFDPVQVGDGTITPGKMQQFRDSVAEWAGWANLTFVENISSQPNYITVKETPGLGGGFSSSVGMAGGEQTVEFAPQAWNRGTICHEVGHALGLWHEQQRTDRDTYVVIHWENIDDPQEPNFAIVPGSQTFGSAYDFYSVMHYRRDALSNNGQNTITMQPAYAQFINIIGQVYDRTLSKIERAGMAAVYGAPAIAPSAVVTTTKDSGSGSLRNAIYYAFDRSTDPVPTPTTVMFHIPTSDPNYNAGSGVFTIRPTFELVAPGAGTTIDGGTQTAFTGNTNPNGPEVMLDGSQITVQNLGLFATGLILREANCTVRNLVISGFNTQGVRFDGLLAATNGTSSSGNVVSGCYIGTDPSGSVGLGNGPNGWPGIELFGGAHNNTIGGLTSNTRNVIAGNTGHGIRIAGSGTNNNQVTGNYIGTNATGMSALGNRFAGAVAESGAQNNVIGGTSAAARNIISGNQNEGVVLDGAGTNGNSVTGNYIGANAAGTAAIGNGSSGHWAGVSIYGGAQNNIVGGTAPGASNVISGNTGQGLLIADSASSGNVVQGNLIGTNVNGSSAWPNQWAGVSIYGGAQSNTIGGSTSSARNLISGNGNQGITISDAGTSGNVIQGNYIGTNAAGTAALPNSYAGISIYLGASANTIGGLTSLARNLISGNANQGITLSDSGTTANVVKGNYIGLDVSGLNSIPNQYSGVDIFLGASGNTIGGTAGGARNHLSGNGGSGGSGISISGSGTNNNIVQGNTIGLNIVGASVPNTYQGVAIFGGASGNTIGGTNVGASNLIAANTFEGVAVFDAGSVNNRISQNSIFSNGFRGIGIYTNSNHNIPIPTLSSAVLGPPGNVGGSTVDCAFTPVTADTYRFEFFSSPAGTDQGKTFIGSITSPLSAGFTTVLGGFPLPAIPAGSVVTATVTDSSGDSSQFSNPTTVTVTDSDSDGTPDSWMNAHFGHPTGQAADLSRANDDADGDGLTNLQEFFAGTDPRISASALRITGTSKSATDVSFTFSSVAGRIYRIETRDDLISPNWLLFQDTIVATGASTQITDFGARAFPHRFYRVLIEP